MTYNVFGGTLNPTTLLSHLPDHLAYSGETEKWREIVKGRKMIMERGTRGRDGIR